MDLKERVESKIKKCFKICYKNIEANQRIHKTFINFCEEETDSNYLQGIKRLLEVYGTDWKYAELSQNILDLKHELFKLKEQKQEIKKERTKVKTFGKEELK